MAIKDATYNNVMFFLIRDQHNRVCMVDGVGCSQQLCRRHPSSVIRHWPFLIFFASCTALCIKFHTLISSHVIKTKKKKCARHVRWPMMITYTALSAAAYQRMVYVFTVHIRIEIYYVMPIVCKFY